MHKEISRINFDEEKSLSVTDYINLTELSREHLYDVHTYIAFYIRNTPTRSTRTSLGVFLIELKTGMLSTVFGIYKSSINRAVSAVREALATNFLPHFW